jgi:hypothetical protein
MKKGSALRGVVLLLAAFPAGSQTADRAIGEVTAIRSENHQIALKTDPGDAVDIVLSDSTLYLRVPPGEKDLKNALRIKLGDIAVGDRVLARGRMAEDKKSLAAASVLVMTRADIAKKHEADRAGWQHRGVAGLVTAVDREKNEFTLASRTRQGTTSLLVENAGQARYRRYAPDSVRFTDARPSAFAELQTGDQVRILGEKDADGTRIKAEEIVFGTFRNVAATINAVDPASGEIRVTDLETKKPLTVKVNADSNLRRMPPMLATMMARRLHGGGEDHGPAPTGTRGGGGGPDFQRMLEHMPAFTLQELKKGDALIISGTKGAEPTRVTAITLLAGVEPLLTAAPQGARQLGGEWNFEVGLP